MSSTLQLPDCESVQQFFSGLFDLEVSGKVLPDATPTLFAVAEYVDDDEKICGYIGCDIDLACKLAAALTRIPAGGVEDAIEAGELSENLVENLFEVLNIGVNIFDTGTSHHMVLQQVLRGSEAIAANSLQESLASATCLTVELDVERYGTGQIAIAVPSD